MSTRLPLKLSAIPMIEAVNYTPNVGRTVVDLIVIHSTQGGELSGTARNVATYFAGDRAPIASAHYVVDPSLIIRCVKDEDVAWHAFGVNKRGIGIELCGLAEQSTTQWHDEFSQAILNNAIELADHLCRKWSIPPVFVGPELLSAQRGRGFTTHAVASKAFPGHGGHWDPGPGFPLEWFIGRVAASLTEQKEGWE